MSKEFDLEKVYDEEIAPIMTKLIGICKQHKLPMFATFFYFSSGEEDSFCTTNLLFEERDIPRAFRSLEPTIRSPRGPALRIRETNADGSVVDTVVLP